MPSDAFKRAARRAIDRPFFLAGALHTYQEENGLSDTELADFLGCRPEDLPRLALCRQPVESSFLKDVTHLASRFGLNGGRLAALIRDIEVSEEFQVGSGPTAMAARDREDNA
jgi:hypothetical protein